MVEIRIVMIGAADLPEKRHFLEGLGFCVESLEPSPRLLSKLRSDPPDAVLIELSRRPSLGRDLGIALRRFKDTRQVPILFMEGTQAEERKIRKILPDAGFSSWEQVGPELHRLLASPVRDPVVPPSAMAAYSQTPLPKKLGIKEDAVVVLVRAPEEVKQDLSPLPAGAILRWKNQGKRDLTLWFNRSQSELSSNLEKMIQYSTDGGLWILWPKKASGISTDLTQQVVRKIGLAAGMVDFKICSFNPVWSGLRFSLRKE